MGLALRARDLGAALALYRDHLGFGLEADPPRYRLPAGAR
jgi:catechol 2,3-dioxygenase-like lactoylglutathione lyase family enzyme